MEKQDIAIVLDFQTYLRSRKRQEFTLSELVEHIHSMPFNSYKKTKEEIKALLKSSFMNVSNPLAYIVPRKVSQEKSSDSRTAYMFLEDFVKCELQKKHVLNAGHVARYFPGRLPVFYNKEFLKHEMLSQPFILIDKIAKLMQCAINAKFGHENAVQLRDAAAKLDISEQFTQLIHLLPFIDPIALMRDRCKGQAFFVCLYNVMRLHCLVEYSRTNCLKESDIIDENLKIFDGYYYNVAGVNLSLADIRVNLLKCKNSTDKRRVSKPLAWLLCGSGSANKCKSFGLIDYRRRLACSAPEYGYPLLHSGLQLQPVIEYNGTESKDCLSMSQVHKVDNRSTQSNSPYRYSMHTMIVKHIGSVSETDEHGRMKTKKTRSENWF